MPYSTEKKGILLPRDKDRRVHLSEKDRQEILALKNIHSLHKLAEMFQVSRRLVQFTIFPERYAKARADAKLRRADGRYKPTKEKWAQTMREHRAYKYQTLKNYQ
jgi:hypothetical protein